MGGEWWCKQSLLATYMYIYASRPRQTLELPVREYGPMAANSIAQPREMHAGLEV
jgi:hypothetical protein